MWVTMRFGAQVGLLCAVLFGAASQWQYLGITIPCGGFSALPPSINCSLSLRTDQGWGMAIEPRNNPEDAYMERVLNGEVFPDTIIGAWGFVFFTSNPSGIHAGFRHWFVITAFVCLNILVWWLDRRRRARRCED